MNHLITKVYAEDKDPGENGRVTYHFKVGNNLTQATDEFSIHEHNGELRTLTVLDRERKSSYQVYFYTFHSLLGVLYFEEMPVSNNHFN